MDDFSFWWYIIAAVVYFLSRGKKKNQERSIPEGEGTTRSRQQPKSFEDLLREITEGRQESQPAEVIEQKPVIIDTRKVVPAREEPTFHTEGSKRYFADDESRRIYEESIKMAEGMGQKLERDESLKAPRLFKGSSGADSRRISFGQELMEGFDQDEAKKAIIYAEIINRKY